MKTHISIHGIDITISSNGKTNSKKNNSQKKPENNSENGNRTGSIIPKHFDLDESECRIWNAVKNLIQVINTRGNQDV